MYSKSFKLSIYALPSDYLIIIMCVLCLWYSFTRKLQQHYYNDDCDLISKTSKRNTLGIQSLAPVSTLHPSIPIIARILKK